MRTKTFAAYGGRGLQSRNLSFADARRPLRSTNHRLRVVAEPCCVGSFRLLGSWQPAPGVS